MVINICVNYFLYIYSSLIHFIKKQPSTSLIRLTQSLLHEVLWVDGATLISFVIQIRNFLLDKNFRNSNKYPSLSFTLPKLFTIANFLIVSNIYIHNTKTTNLEVLFAQRSNIKTADNDLINKCIIHRFNHYKAFNTPDWSLQYYIQIDFEKFEVKYFDQIDSPT